MDVAFKVLESIKNGDATDKDKGIAQQKYNAIETNANEFITHFTASKNKLDLEIANLNNKKKETDNKKTLQTEATKEQVAAEEEFRELEETLKDAINEIQEKINENKKDKKSGGGGKRIKYKSTGDEVVILYKNRECRKTIYVKEKTTTKYCKINNKYILLSKLNVID